ncbi:MAG: hypothetical protein IJV40_12090, partial [Oscillospiraceae bacterium]|nr:hypothetical protein [Oscillospiraceae bacterium]
SFSNDVIHYNTLRELRQLRTSRKLQKIQACLAWLDPFLIFSCQTPALFHRIRHFALCACFIKKDSDFLLAKQLYFRYNNPRVFMPII